MSEIQAVTGGWANVTLKDIEIEKSQFPALPLTEYTFQIIPGASFRQATFADGNSVTDLNIPLAIAEGDHKGRRVFVKYPDPTSTNREGKLKAWSKQAVKKLQVVLGEDAYDGEDAVTYFNRVATSGVARFRGTLKQGTYIKQGNTEPEPELNVWSVKPAA